MFSHLKSPVNETMVTIAQRCLDGAHAGTIDFPSIVGALMEAGFEGYDVDYRRGTSTYFTADGDSAQLSFPGSGGAVAAAFRADEVAAAVREAQDHAPGYTYAGFCAKVKAAGCAGYMVSLLGRRVVYFGRTGEMHVEHFPS